MEERKVKIRLNLPALINDLGGAAAVAKMTGVVRTAPYGWVRRRYVSSQILEKIKAHNPDINFDIYFDEVTNDQDEQARRSAGVS